jgi:GGDEF domain-containing protein
MMDVNPLTGLPGNLSIRNALNDLVIDRGGSAAYVDIINFKPFNDYYGFALGDSVIRRLGLILKESLPDHFTGHIGGDDFICAGDGESFRNGVENARQRFRSIIPGFYSQRDRDFGGIETFDREGSYRFFPLLDVSVVFTDSGKEEISVESLALKVGRAKKLLKGEQIAEPIFPLLEKAIETGYHIDDTKALIEACGVLREEGAVPALSGLLEGSYSWKLRKSAALALGYIGSTQCTELLLKALHDSNPHVRTRSVEGLVVSMGRKSGDIIASMADDSSTWVRRAVSRGMGYAGWHEGLHHLRSRAVGTAPGLTLNTTEERRAALEGISLLGLAGDAVLLARLCRETGYYPHEGAYKALCAVGTDVAAEEVIKRNCDIPQVLNLSGVNRLNLEKLEAIAVRSLGGNDQSVSAALRFFEGFPVDVSRKTAAELRNCLGSFYGDRFRRLVILLDSRGLAADRSCIARVAKRIDSGQQIGTPALTAFLAWVSRMGGVSPGCLMKSFLRGERRAVAASAALAVRSLALRDLTQTKNGETIQ